MHLKGEGSSRRVRALSGKSWVDGGHWSSVDCQEQKARFCVCFDLTKKLLSLTPWVYKVEISKMGEELFTVTL